MASPVRTAGQNAGRPQLPRQCQGFRGSVILILKADGWWAALAGSQTASGEAMNVVVHSEKVELPEESRE
jgi:hypothetical protein